MQRATVHGQRWLVHGQSWAWPALAVRPKTAPFWFDLLAFTLDRLGECLATEQCSCGCQGHGEEATLPPNAQAIAKPKPTKKPAGSWGQCAFCWAMTFGSAAGFCYQYGGCD